MTDDDYKSIVVPMPNFVSVDLSSQLARLNSMATFDYVYRDQKQRTDALLSKIISVLMDRQFINTQVAGLARQFMSEVMNAIERATLSSQDFEPNRMDFNRQSDARLRVMDDMILFEQTALDVADVFQQLKLYRHNRFLPYLYETTINPRAVVLTKINSFEYLCDQIPTLSMSPFTEPD